MYLNLQLQIVLAKGVEFQRLLVAALVEVVDEFGGADDVGEFVALVYLFKTEQMPGRLVPPFDVVALVDEDNAVGQRRGHLLHTHHHRLQALFFPVVAQL